MKRCSSLVTSAIVLFAFVAAAAGRATRERPSFMSVWTMI